MSGSNSQINEQKNVSAVLKKENDQLGIHKRMMEKEIDDLKNELSKQVNEKNRFYEILVKIKNSFYHSNLSGLLKEQTPEQPNVSPS